MTPNPDRILEILRSVRAESKAMDIQPLDVPSTINFLNGFALGCFACGLDDLDVRESATVARGWTWSAAGPIGEMRERGLSEEAIVHELIETEIAVWTLWFAEPEIPRRDRFGYAEGEWIGDGPAPWSEVNP